MEADNISPVRGSEYIWLFTSYIFTGENNIVE